MSSSYTSCFCADKREKIYKSYCNNSNGYGNHMINKNIMEREELQDQYESTKDILLTSDRNCMCHTKSKSYELNNKKLYKEEKSRRKDISHGLNISSNVMFLFIIVLFSCWNSAVFAFHLNEESNSVYPKMKSISSSSFSHKRHSKTVEVFYPSGVSFYFSFVFIKIINCIVKWKTDLFSSKI